MTGIFRETGARSNDRMIARVLEPEVMDTVDEAVEYDRMDHQAVNERFVEDFLRAAEQAVAGAASGAAVLDLGTGTAHIPIVLCGAWSGCHVAAVDMAREMLRV